MKWRICRAICLAFHLLSAETNTPPAAKCHVSIGFGMTTENLHWTISNQTPHFVSKVSFANLETLCVHGTCQWILPHGQRLHFEGRYGHTMSGTSRDFDQVAHKTFADMTALSNHGSMMRGHLRYVYAVSSRFDLITSFFYSHRVATLEYGEFVIRPSQFSVFLSDLKSVYTARWIGPWIGGGIHINSYMTCQLEGGVLGYYGSGRWNLRADHAGPYHHFAPAVGGSVCTVLSIPLSRNCHLQAKGEWIQCIAFHGVDTTKYRENQRVYSTSCDLKEVTSCQTSWSIDFVWRW